MLPLVWIKFVIFTVLYSYYPTTGVNWEYLWGRQLKQMVASKSGGLFFCGVRGRCPEHFNLSMSKVAHFMRDNRGELVLSEAEGNPLGDANYFRWEKDIGDYTGVLFQFLPEDKSLWDQPSSPLFHFKNSNQLDKKNKKGPLCGFWTDSRWKISYNYFRIKAKRHRRSI